MSGEKLTQAQDALRFCVRNLNDKDRFQIVRFSTEAEPLFNQLEPANKAHRQDAQQFIDSFKAIGGTAIAERSTMPSPPSRIAPCANTAPRSSSFSPTAARRSVK